MRKHKNSIYTHYFDDIKFPQYSYIINTWFYTIVHFNNTKMIFVTVYLKS